MERDEKGRYKKGNGPINKEVAREYQARAAVVRKENREKRETLAEVLKRQLQEKVDSGSEMTKLEFIVAKALQNHSRGTLSLKDLTYLQKLLGEDTLNINTNGPQMIVVSAASIQSAKKWSKKKDE
jgi:hypothetical protein